jgi:hypothetical protein
MFDQSATKDKWAWRESCLEAVFGVACGHFIAFAGTRQPAGVVTEDTPGNDTGSSTGGSDQTSAEGQSAAGGGAAIQFRPGSGNGEAATKAFFAKRKKKKQEQDVRVPVADGTVFPHQQRV